MRYLGNLILVDARRLALKPVLAPVSWIASQDVSRLRRGPLKWMTSCSPFGPDLKPDVTPVNGSFRSACRPGLRVGDNQRAAFSAQGELAAAEKTGNSVLSAVTVTQNEDMLEKPQARAAASIA